MHNNKKHLCTQQCRLTILGKAPVLHTSFISPPLLPEVTTFFYFYFNLSLTDREAWCAVIHGVTKSWT